MKWRGRFLTFKFCCNLAHSEWAKQDGGCCELTCVPPKDVLKLPVLVNGTLFGNTALADVINVK